jgi:transcriptional antiterminator NusG
MEPCEPGDRVRLLDGPFTGYRGTVRAIDHDAQRIMVLVRVFGRPTVVELHYEQVDSLAHDDPADDLS